MWGGAVGSVAVVALLTWWAVGSIGSKARSDREHILTELLAASASARAAGDLGGAFREIEAALIQARKLDPEGSSRVDALTERRDQAARAEVESRLGALPRLNPEPRAGEAEILAERVRRDPALAALADRVDAALEQALTARAEADRDRSRAELQAGRGREAFQAASQAHDRAGHLAARADSDRIQVDARALIVLVAERYGLILAPVAAAADSGTASFAQPLWAEALAQRGYLTLPGGSPWTEVWAAHAPFQAAARVVEGHEGLYLQSQNRPTQIDGQFTLTNRGQPRWQARIYTQTRSPLLDMPAYMAGRLATASHRDAEIERRLQDDARAAFRLQTALKFRGIPAAGGAPSSPAVGSAPSS